MSERAFAHIAVAQPRAFHLREAGLGLLAILRALANRHQASRELAQFDARMLGDIGLTQGDVASAFAEPLWKDPTLRLSVLAIERRAATRSRRAKLKAVEPASSRETACLPD